MVEYVGRSDKRVRERVDQRVGGNRDRGSDRGLDDLDRKFIRFRHA